MRPRRPLARHLAIIAAAVVAVHALAFSCLRHTTAHAAGAVASAAGRAVLHRVALQAAPVPRLAPASTAGDVDEPPPDGEPPLSFVPAAALDHEIVPRSAPDLQQLQGLRFSGLPMRLRLFIDAQGMVVDVRVLASEESEETLAAVSSMFRSTAFVPGERAGRAVPAFTDIELQLDPHEG